MCGLRSGADVVCVAALSGATVVTGNHVAEVCQVFSVIQSPQHIPTRRMPVAL